MSNQNLCITFRFIQPFPLFHGRADADIPEWPPSPLRAFQALLNAACLRARGKPLGPELRSAVQILEGARPEIIAPRATVSSVGYRAYVPHNQYDLVFAALHRGMEPSTETFRKLSGSVRAEKDYRPMRIEVLSEDFPTVHYLYPLNAITLNPDEYLRVIRPSVRAITHLGWGIDQVVADATLIDPSSPQLSGERWLPSARTGGRRLRVHRNGTLDALTKRYSQFLNRLQNGWTPISPLAAGDVDQVPYRRDTDPLPHAHVVFKLVDENEDPFRYPHAKLIHIAGMVRHLAIKAMDPKQGSPPPWIDNPADWVSRVVRGKRDDSAGDKHQQFSYVPLPSIGPHADALVRNVMIAAPLGMERELNYLADRLDGLPLEPESDPESGRTDSVPSFSGRVELVRFKPPSRKFIAECYLSSSSVWETVTPVILDGINRKSKNDKPETIAHRTEKLICKALARAGIEAPCEFTWQSLPFMKNALSAHKYDRQGNRTGYFRPSYLDGRTAVHVRIKFGRRQADGSWIPIEVPGPLVIGAGRHCGFGLLAATSQH